MKKRLSHLRSTVPGVAVLAFLAFVLWLRPDKVDDLGTLAAAAAGLAAIFYGGRSNG